MTSPCPRLWVPWAASSGSFTPLAPGRTVRLSAAWGTLARMAESMPLAAVDLPFQALVRRTMRQRERITIIDPDEPASVVISAEELEDLEDALAVAQSRLREASGETVWVAHDEVKRRLGLDR